MRILFVISDFATGGAEKITETLIREMNFGNNEITLAIFNSVDMDSVSQRVPSECRIISFKKEARPTLSFLAAFGRQVLYRGKYDLIIANLQPVAFYLGLLIPLLCSPVVYIIHNDYPLLKNKLKRTIVEHFYRSHKVTPVSVSDQIAGSFYIKYKFMPKVIDNGILPPQITGLHSDVITEIESLKVASSTVVFIGVQRLVWFKNLPALASAFKILNSRGYNAILLLLGDDPTEGQGEKERIKSIGAANVFLLGHRDNIADYLSASDCFCIVSSAFEGASVALLEAISAGLPVIGTFTGGIPSVISDPDNGILCEPTVESITNALIRFMEMPAAEKQEICEANRNLFESKYHEAIMAQKYHELFSELTIKHS